MDPSLLGAAQPQVEIERRATRKLGSQATVARGDDLVAETTWYADDLPGDGSCGHSAAWADAVHWLDRKRAAGSAGEAG